MGRRRLVRALPERRPKPPRSRWMPSCNSTSAAGTLWGDPDRREFGKGKGSSVRPTLLKTKTTSFSFSLRPWLLPWEPLFSEQSFWPQSSPLFSERLSWQGPSLRPFLQEPLPPLFSPQLSLPVLSLPERWRRPSLGEAAWPLLSWAPPLFLRVFWPEPERAQP